MDERKIWIVLWSVVLFLCILGGVLSCNSNRKVEDGIVTSKHQKGNITYLVFELSGGYGGIAVVNYTADSVEYELLKSSTKIKDCEEDIHLSK